MPPKRKISSKYARALLSRVATDTVASLIDDAIINRASLRGTYGEPIQFYGDHPIEPRYVGFGDIYQYGRTYGQQPPRERFKRFRFRGKAKKTRILGKRKRN